MNFSDLRLPSGTTLQLQFIDVSGERSPTKLIGSIEGISVLVTQPQKGGKSVGVVNGERVIVRAITSSAAIAFQTVVQKVCTSPASYLHLEYPSEVTVNRVRASPRISIVVEAKVTNKSADNAAESVDAKLLDLSPTGARLELPSGAVKIGDELNIVSVFNFSDVDREVSLQAIVRARMSEKEEQHSDAPVVYGVEFQDLTEELTLFLHAYVYQRMLEG
ncbi:MAG: flagellar brake protein [Pseudohongiellaceae bacterium]|nr:flagellar brake protein [Pseudohongiellaceae bacterium]